MFMIAKKDLSVYIVKKHFPAKETLTFMSDSTQMIGHIFVVNARKRSTRQVLFRFTWTYMAMVTMKISTVRDATKHLKTSLPCTLTHYDTKMQKRNNVFNVPLPSKRKVHWKHIEESIQKRNLSNATFVKRSTDNLATLQNTNWAVILKISPTIVNFVRNHLYLSKS